MDTTANDQSRCQQLLDFRDNGISFAVFVHNYRRRYIFRVGLLAAAAYLAIFGGEAGKNGGLLVVGMLFGMVIQDFSWIDGVRRAWPFTARVTKWELVEQIANGCPPPTEERI